MTKTIFKTLFLILAIWMTSIKVMGQTVKDYFIPSQLNYNKASFYTPSKTGDRTEMTRVIYYVPNNDGTYLNTISNMFQGQPSSISTQTLIFTATEVKMTKSVSTTMLKTNQEEFYEPATTVLKMPLVGQTTNWTYTDISGEKIKRTASWTTILVDGINKKAIKVTSIIIGAEDFGKTIDYYVKGIGLWKTDLIGDDGIIMPYYKFDGLSYEPTSR